MFQVDLAEIKEKLSALEKNFTSGPRLAYAGDAAYVSDCRGTCMGGCSGSCVASCDSTCTGIQTD